MSRVDLWHRKDLSLNTVLRVYAMSKSCEPIKAKYTEEDRKKWFSDMIALLKGRNPLTWTNSYESQRPCGFTVRNCNDRHYIVQATSVMQGWLPVIV